MGKAKLIKPKMIEALRELKGNVSKACEKCGITRQTHQNWMEADADYKQIVENIKEATLDHVENKLMELIDDGDTTATIFYLKTQGKKRGYVETERKEISGKMNIDSTAISKLPKDLLYQVADKLQGIDGDNE